MRPLLLLLALLSGLSPLQAQTRPAKALPEVWIAPRTDGAKGKGTPQDPWDGSTAAKLKALLNAIPEDTRIHFTEGTFPLQPTSRRDSAGAVLCGVELKSGWKIEGAGQGRTILRADYSGLTLKGGNNAFYLLQGGLASPLGLDGFELRRLTLDCNPGPGGSNLPAPTAIALALGLNGTRCLVEDVEMVHGYNGRHGKDEGFFVAVGRPTGADGRGNTVRNCRLHDMGEGRSLNLLLALSGFGDSTFANRDVLFEGNVLDGFDANGRPSEQGLNWFTAGGRSSLPNFRMAGNTVRGCRYAAYSDTAATPLDNCQIVRNTFEVPENGTGIYVIHALAHAFIDGNTFLFAGGKSSELGQGVSLGQGGPALSGLMVSNNVFRGRMRQAVNLNDDPRITDALFVNNRVEGSCDAGTIVGVKSTVQIVEAPATPATAP